MTEQKKIEAPHWIPEALVPVYSFVAQTISSIAEVVKENLQNPRSN